MTDKQFYSLLVAVIISVVFLVIVVGKVMLDAKQKCITETVAHGYSAMEIYLICGSGK